MKIAETYQQLLTITQYDNGHKAYKEAFDTAGELKDNYQEFLRHKPINCDLELKRLHEADYDQCCAMITMLLEEEKYSPGAFAKRLHQQEPQKIIDRMLWFLS